MNNMENITPAGEEVIVESIKDINPDAPTMTFIGNVPVITETQYPEAEPVRTDEAYYLPECDDNMSVGLIAIIAIVVVAAAYFFIKHF